MQTFSKALAAICGGAAGAMLFASSASAGCVDVPAILAQRAWTSLRAPARGAYAATPDRASAGDWDDGASIVGLWQFTFTSQGNDAAPPFIPDGAPLDSGYTQWHSDETEIMNSSRDPATSNFCLGVYTSVGVRKYRLNHFALSWDNTGKFCTPDPGAPSCFVGPANIREEITLDRRGNSYSGTVTIDQYDTHQHVIAHLTGTVSAQRITP